MSKFFSENSKLKNSIPIMLIVLFFLFRLPYCLSNGFIPDELWHSGYMINFHSLPVTNYQGHGTGFWIFGHLLTYVFGSEAKFLYALRVSSLLAFCGSSYLIYMAANRTAGKKYALLTLLVFLSLPMAWWGGKLIFVEFYSIYLLTLAGYVLLFKNGKFLPWILMGFCIGLKVTSIPVVVMLFMNKVFLIDEHATLSLQFCKKILSYSCLILLGFIICNPNILWNVDGFIGNLPNTNLNINLRFFNLFNLFSTETVSWDLVHTRGLSKHVFPAINLVLLSIIIFWLSSFRGRLIYFITIITFLIVFGNTGTQHVWLAFQSTLIIFIPLVYYPVFLKASRKYFVSLGALSAVFFINIYSSIPIYQNNNFSRNMMVNSIENRTEISKCIITYLNNIDLEKDKIGIIFNRSEMGGNSLRQELLTNPEIKKKVHWLVSNRLARKEIFSTNLDDWKSVLEDGRMILILNNRRDQLFSSNLFDVKQIFQIIKNKFPHQLTPVNFEYVSKCDTVDIVLARYIR